MDNTYEKFVEWAKDNNIELSEDQYRVAKSILSNEFIIFPRQQGRIYGIEPIIKFLIR